MVREKAAESFYDLILGMTNHHFCYILLVTQATDTFWEEITQGHENQEAGIVGSPLGFGL